MYRSARLIELSKKIPPKKIQRATPFFIIIIVGIFGLITTTVLITTNSNISYFKAAAFLTQYLQDINRINASNDKITVISDPFYLWIPQYVFHLKHEYVPFYMLISIKTEKVAFIIDRNFLDGLAANEIFKKFYDLYAAKKQEAISMGDPTKNGVIVALSERPSTDLLQDKTTNLIDMNHTWNSLNGATVSQDGILHISINNNNTDRTVQRSCFTHAN